MRFSCFLCEQPSRLSAPPGQDREAWFLCEQCRTWNRLKIVERGDQPPEVVVVGIEVKPPQDE